MRAEFNEYCVRHGLYNTMILFSRIPIIYNTNIPTYAGITNRYHNVPGNWAIMLNPTLFNTSNLSYQECFFILCHELSHVGQMASKFIMDNYKINGQLLNVAMDMAIHENLRKVSPEFEKILTEGIGKNFVLRERVLPNAPAGQDWYTYYNLLKNDPNTIKVPMLGEGEQEGESSKGTSDEERGGCDSHNFDTSEEARSATEKLVQETNSAAKGIMRSQGRGNIPADDCFFPSLTQVDARLAEMLNKVRVTVANLLGGKAKRPNWMRYNKVLDSDMFPGKKPMPLNRLKPNPVVVLDTSGSQWSKHVLDQLFSGANLIRKQYPECDIYTCDTELHRFSGKELRGGGGTIFDSAHITQILIDKGLPIEGNSDKRKALDVVYITDGAVDLIEVSKDSRINFFPIVWSP